MTVDQLKVNKISGMVAPKAGNKVEPAMIGEEANLGLVSLELTGSNRSVTWLNELDDDEVTHMIRLHQIIIGKNADKGEEQVIEAQFPVTGGKKTSTPLAFLSRGQTNSVQMEVHFPAGTIFSLSEGQGPVHILGSHIVSPTPEEDVVEEDLEEEEDEEEDAENGDVLLNDEKHLEHGILEENLKKRKQDGECENGMEAKKLKHKNLGNSGSEEDGEPNDSPATE